MWHHFDPPWSVTQHHDPSGMVALCRDHHPEADTGAFTAEQLRAFKHSGRDSTTPLVGRFNWMRHDLLAVVGGNFYLRTPIILRVREQPLIWFTRDHQGHLLLNVLMPTATAEPRLVIEENFWLTEGTEEADIECPPSGKTLRASYGNGDQLRIQFREITTEEEFDRRYPPPKIPRAAESPWERTEYQLPPNSEGLGQAGGAVPVTSVEVELRAPGTELDFGPRVTKAGGVTLAGGWVSDCSVALQIG